MTVSNQPEHMVIKSLLNKLGLRVTLAGNGQQAADAVAHATPNSGFNLVLIDWQDLLDSHTHSTHKDQP